MSAPTAMRPAVAMTSAPNARVAQPAVERRRSRPIKARPPCAIASRGSPAPIAYATTRTSVEPEPGVVTARLVMAPRIGPAQGVQTSPRPRPVMSPPTTLACFGSVGCPSVKVLLDRPINRPPTPCNLTVARSQIWLTAGTSNVRPKIAMTAMATSRSAELGRWSAEMTWTLASVKNEKLAIRPTITRYGRRRSPSAPVASTTGRIGRTHGDTAVTRPATNATSTSSSMGLPRRARTPG